MFRNFCHLFHSVSSQNESVLVRTLCPYCIRNTPNLVTLSIWRRHGGDKRRRRGFPSFVGEETVFFPDHHSNFRGSSLREDDDWRKRGNRRHFLQTFICAMYIFSCSRLLYRYFAGLSGLNTKIHANGSRTFFGADWPIFQVFQEKLNFTLE